MSYGHFQVSLLTVIFNLHTGVFPGGCRPSDPPHKRAGMGSGGPILGCIFLYFSMCFCFFVVGFRPREVLILLLVKFHVECRQNHVWVPPGGQVMSIFVKTDIFAKDALGETHGKKERYKLYRMVFSKYKTLDFWSAL